MKKNLTRSAYDHFDNKKRRYIAKNKAFFAELKEVEQNKEAKTPEPLQNPKKIDDDLDESSKNKAVVMEYFSDMDPNEQHERF